MTKEELKQQLAAWLDARKDELIASGETLLRMPELAYREDRTAEYVRNYLQKYNLPLGKTFAITGQQTRVDTGRPGPRLAILGELDAIIVPGHPFYDPQTRAAHACGHHAGLNAMLACAAALSQPDILRHLAGSLAFMACPSEECQDQPYIADLIRQGKLRYFGGKSEMIAEGLFDDIDIALTGHASPVNMTPSGFNGFIMKRLIFHGRAAHAGANPERGVNAISMMRSAMNLLDAQRDTFRDESHIRIHGYIPYGGEAVNVVPDRTEFTLQVRGSMPDAVRDASDKTDRCMQAAALAFAGKVTVQNLFGFMPLVPYTELDDIHQQNVAIIAPGAPFTRGVYRPSSTDMGDVSMIRPSLHAYFRGFSGTPHTPDFLVTAPEQAYVDAAKYLAFDAIDLLWNDATCGTAVAKASCPMTKQAYLDEMDSYSSEKSYDYFA